MRIGIGNLGKRPVNVTVSTLMESTLTKLGGGLDPMGLDISSPAIERDRVAISQTFQISVI